MPPERAWSSTPTAGFRPATSPIWMRTATCFSWTERKSSLSDPGTTCTRERGKRTPVCRGGRGGRAQAGAVPFRARPHLLESTAQVADRRRDHLEERRALGPAEAAEHVLFEIRHRAFAGGEDAPALGGQTRRK